MKLSKILIKTQERIRDPRRWCQYTSAKGDRCCVVGALRYAIVGDPRTIPEDEEYEAARDILASVAGQGPATVNDEHGHAAVMDMLDAAISAAMSDEAMES